MYEEIGKVTVAIVAGVITWYVLLGLMKWHVYMRKVMVEKMEMLKKMIKEAMK